MLSAANRPARCGDRLRKINGAGAYPSCSGQGPPALHWPYPLASFCCQQARRSGETEQRFTIAGLPNANLAVETTRGQALRFLIVGQGVNHVVLAAKVANEFRALAC